MPTFLPMLRELLASGQTLTTAGAYLGISRSSAHRWIDRYGMDADSRRTKPRVPPDDRARIQALVARGTSTRAVANRFGIARSTVRQIVDQPPAAFRCPTCGGKSLVSPCRVCAISRP